MSTFDTVKNIIEDHMGPTPEIKPESKFIGDLGCDSLDTVELVIAIEEQFEIEISDDAAEKLITVSDVVAFIDRAKAA